MRSFAQTVLLWMYRLIGRLGILDTRLGRRGFFVAYNVYKSTIEASEVDVLRRWVCPDTWVVDVGANVGFFTRRFATWVGDRGWVFAIEPEARNLGELRRAIEKSGITGRVEVFEGVAADRPGTLRLATNPYHPGDHRLAADGVEVAATSLDHEFAHRGWPAVSLIKIDVQGAEFMVIEGARELIERQAPVLYVEVDPAALAQQGRTVDELLGRLQGAGYVLHLISSSGELRRIDGDEVLRELNADLSYLDLLCIPENGVAANP